MRSIPMPPPSTGKRPRRRTSLSVSSDWSASSITPSDSASNITDKRHVFPASIKGTKAFVRGAQGGNEGIRGKGGVHSRKPGVKAEASGGEDFGGGVKREEASIGGDDRRGGGGRGGGGAGGGAKARLSPHVKRAIAQEIVRRGVANLDINDICTQVRVCLVVASGTSLCGCIIIARLESHARPG